MIILYWDVCALDRQIRCRKDGINKKCIPQLQTSFNTTVGIQANTTELIPNTTTIQYELEEYISHIFLSCGNSFYSVDTVIRLSR